MGSFDKSSMKVLGIILLVVGCIIWYLVGKRRFNRRTITGVEVFRSYENAWLTRLGESVLRLIALFLIILGVSALILSCD